LIGVVFFAGRVAPATMKTDHSRRKHVLDPLQDAAKHTAAERGLCRQTHTRHGCGLRRQPGGYAPRRIERSTGRAPRLLEQLACWLESIVPFRPAAAHDGSR